VTLFMLAAVFVAFERPPVLAQQASGAVLAGTVLDPAARAIHDASVVARNESSGATNRTKTDQEGRLSVADLAPGSYTVHESAAGFALAARQGVRVTAGHAEGLAISL